MTLVNSTKHTQEDTKDEIEDRQSLVLVAFQEMEQVCSFKPWPGMVRLEKGLENLSS